MRIEPVSYKGKKVNIPLNYEAVADADVYEDVWLPLGDDKEVDLFHLLEQGRIRRD